MAGQSPAQLQAHYREQEARNRLVAERERWLATGHITPQQFLELWATRGQVANGEAYIESLLNYDSSAKSSHMA